MKATKLGTFEERHHKALDKAHAELRSLLRQHIGLGGCEFLYAVDTYRQAMGYPDVEGSVDPWVDAVTKAWRSQVWEKGESVNLGETLDRAIRESAIAIGERWPTEPKPKRKFDAVPNKRAA